MLEIRENEYCTNEAYELTQCWATNATFYFELYDSAREFVNCTGATADFQRMICFLPPSGQEFDAALLISGIGVSYSVFKAITIALAFGLFRMCPSGRRGIDTTVFLIFFTVRPDPLMFPAPPPWFTQHWFCTGLCHRCPASCLWHFDGNHAIHGTVRSVCHVICVSDGCWTYCHGARNQVPLQA